MSHSPVDDKKVEDSSSSSVEALPATKGLQNDAVRQLDVALALPGMTGEHGDDDVDPAESRSVKRKLDWRIMPLLCLIYTVQFLDKNNIGASAILGFLTDAHLTGEKLNNLGTFFYVGMLASQLPHAYAFQKLPVAKYLAVMMFLWAVLVGVHAVGTNYHSLIAIRLLLGFTEGCITPGLMLVTSMYYTRAEMGERVGLVFQCNGLASILSGFIAFGAYHAPNHTPLSLPQNHGKVAQWQWFMIIISLLTLVTSILFALFFPDSPTNAKFLSAEERVVAVKRIKTNQSGVETKSWKWAQFREAITDPKAYIFMLYAVLANFVGGIGVQYTLIIKDFGFKVWQTTLLNIPGGALMIITVTVSMWIFHKYPNARGWISAGSYVPCMIAALVLVIHPNNRTVLLIAFYGIQLGCTPAVVLSLSWITTTTSGHTKKLVLNAMWLIGYSVGQMVAPQWWKDKYKPSNRVPWLIILISYGVQVVIILYLRWFLQRRNRIRDEAAKNATTEEEKELYGEYGWLEVAGADGTVSKVRVEKRFLDLTDFENKNFRYVL